MSMPVVFHIEPMFDSLLYVEFVVVLHVLLFTTVQLFNDVLLSIPMTRLMMSLMVLL
jgi:hypothetical protein